jgi:ATP-dependent protease ClpP protease subunit
MLSAIRVLAGLCIAFLSAVSTQAADIIASKAIDGSNVIHISGVISAGDAEKFNLATGTISGGTVVFLASEGGSALEGMSIGHSIRAKGYSTAVANDTECSSACAMIWLAGKTRYMGNSARVGFHAAYTDKGSDAQESGVGNALAGAYLTKLGLSYKAVVFATMAHPNEITWLRPDDAKRTGIQFSALAEYKPALSSHTSQAAHASPTGGVPFLACMALTASVYHLPPRVLPSIQAVESGRIGLVRSYKDGSESLGVMQINLRWIGPLSKFAKLTEAEVRDRLLNDPCFNIAAAGLILRTYLNETKGDLLLAIGKYHSDNPALSQSYQKRVVDVGHVMFAPKP